MPVGVGLVAAVAGSGLLKVGAVAYTAYRSYSSARKARRRAEAIEARLRGALYSVRQAAMSRFTVYGRTRVGPLEVFVQTGGTDNEYLDIILVWGEGPYESIEKVYFNDALAFSGTTAQGDYASYATISHNLGTSTQTALSSAVSAITQWTSAHKLVGIAHSHIRLTYSESVFADGVPSISAVVQGRNDIYDPRLNSGAGGTAYSNNVALCAAHYLTENRFGPQADYATELDETVLTAAANLCDETVALDGGGTEARYTFDGVLWSSPSPEDNIRALRDAMAGTITYVGGTWRLLPGAYRTPTFTLTADMLAGPVQYQPKAGKRELANTVKGITAREADLWQPTDYPARIDSAGLAADGEEIAIDVPLPYSGSMTRAGRIAELELRRIRSQGTLRVRCGIRALRAQVGENIMVTLPRYGLAEAVFHVAEWSLSIEENALIIDMVLRRENSAIYDWDETEDEIDPGAPPSAPENTVATPFVPIPGGSYPSGDYPLSLPIVCSTPGASIRYSLSSVPSSPTDGGAYAGPILVTAGTTLYARAFKAGMTQSAGMTESYTAS